MNPNVELLLVLDEPVLEECYLMYAEVFEEINALAAQRHLLTYDEFCDIAKDSRITKLVARDGDGRLVGIACVTNVLEAWPLLAAPYYQRHFPDHYTRQAIWYVGFLGVLPRRSHVFRGLVEVLYDIVNSNQGLVGMDFCTFNEDFRNLPSVTRNVLLRWNEQTQMLRMDSQTTWVYRFDGGGAPLQPAAVQA